MPNLGSRRGFVASVGFTLLFLPQAGCASALSEVQTRGHWIIGVYLSGYPLAFRDPQGHLAGLEVALARRLAQDRFGSPEQVEFVVLTARERITALEAGTVDMVIGNLSVTPQRARVIDFSTDYYRPYQALAVLQEDPARVLSDLSTARVAVLEGSSSRLGLERFLPQATIVLVPDYPTAYTQLKQGLVRAVSADNTALMGWRDATLRLLEAPLSGYVLAVGFPRGLDSLDLRTWVNSRIAQWQKEGWLKTTVGWWGL
ncbi:transporter substrate-binding domain-containing protein [Anthocerotibacter panamensis]|uniref:transporter substrate-binding domain-containing protein n=1 Tax=Anthocerotibacter panamensis TaxID=2857077 RepID=UPI001C408087|nr:transporter substrate-binding domain-containing protein [Anthocerotibacter panamensis]